MEQCVCFHFQDFIIKHYSVSEVCPLPCCFSSKASISSNLHHNEKLVIKLPVCQALTFRHTKKVNLSLQSINLGNSETRAFSVVVICLHSSQGCSYAHANL